MLQNVVQKKLALAVKTNAVVKINYFN